MLSSVLQVGCVTKNFKSSLCLLFAAKIYLGQSIFFRKNIYASKVMFKNMFRSDWYALILCSQDCLGFLVTPNDKTIKKQSKLFISFQWTPHEGFFNCSCTCADDDRFFVDLMVLWCFFSNPPVSGFLRILFNSNQVCGFSNMIQIRCVSPKRNYNDDQYGHIFHSNLIETKSLENHLNNHYAGAVYI